MVSMNGPHDEQPTVSSSGWLVGEDEQTASAVRLELAGLSLTMWPFNPDFFAAPEPEPAPPITLQLDEVVGLDQLGADVIQPLVEFELASGVRHRLRTTDAFLAQIVEALEHTRVPEPDDADLPPIPDLTVELPALPPRAPATSKRALLKEVDSLRSYIASLGVAERSALQSDIAALTAAVERLTEHRADVLESVREATAELRRSERELVAVEREGRLQSLGVYGFGRPLDDVIPPSEELVTVRSKIADRLLHDRAVHVATDWSINGSADAGRRMAEDMSTLLLRTYNAEAELLVRGLDPFDLVTAVDRLEASATAVSRLGTALEITIDPEFHGLRLKELRLVAEQHNSAKTPSRRS